ncbi:MAG: LptA/OstA family protein [Bilophila wadsworthia]
MKKLFLGITTLSLSLFCSAPLWAAPVTPPKPAKNVETRITSDQLTYLAEKQLVIFDKNVHVVRPDIEIWADRHGLFEATQRRRPEERRRKRRYACRNGSR